MTGTSQRILAKLKELILEIEERQKETAKTAMSFNNGGPSDNKEVFFAYENRAQGQHDILQMLRNQITVMENVGMFEV